MKPRVIHFQRALCALCLLYLSSCSEGCRQWGLRETVTCYPCYNSGRMYLEPESDYHHLELELNRGPSGIHMYLNLLLFPARPLSDDPNRTTAELILNRETLIFYPYCLSGNQRLLIPDDITHHLLEIFSHNQTCSIRVGREEILIVPDNFDVCYRRLMELPIANSGRQE